ncbi:hypothetical protein J8L70_07910 [Pseudoalteromonas sp. MMG010]|uniref:hypothetical protein n=1 Tax=Pseudoalteromonas sp. MMG010 TaxID=2822685 RepID=UPI001B39FCDA|nr:hypothetical protein [Pseudoalteromonas sp. MMG010]MBQ4833162.1 hypothetical protein [Pseudoalteromonas sp. MMG010]
MAMNVVEKCDCGHEISIGATSCNVCNNHVGFPNVRKAIHEEQALASRYMNANASVKLKGLESKRKMLESAMDNSFVIMSRTLVDLISALGDNRMISTFHQQIAGNARNYENNEYDSKRDGYESIISPGYYRDIHYGILSLTDSGSSYYGGASIKLNTAFIKNRTTFFEEDVYTFVEKHKVSATSNPPEGYRATWDKKGTLAVCKLHSKFSANQTVEEMKSLLYSEENNMDYIEAHIHGTITSQIFEKVTILDKDDSMVTCAKILLTNKNIEFQVRGE